MIVSLVEGLISIVGSSDCSGNTFCPGNTFSRANVVGSPRFYPFLAVAKVADIAHFLPLEILGGWSTGRTAHLHTYAALPSGRLHSFFHLCSSLNVVSRIQIFRHVQLYSGCLVRQAPFPPCGSEKSIREI